MQSIWMLGGVLQSISKDALYGSMDPNTREWTDGLFTHILRKYVRSSSFICPFCHSISVSY